MESTTTNLLLGLIATMIGALVFTHKATVKQASEDRAKLDAMLLAAQTQTNETIAQLRRAVDEFASFKTESSVLASKVLDDIRSIASTQAQILEILERISNDARTP